MPTGNNVGADIASYVKAIEQEANMFAREQTLALPLIRGFNDRQGTAIRNRSEYGTVTINQIGDADDLASQTFYPSVQNSLTPYEYGSQFLMTDTRIENDPFNYSVEAREELGAGMAESIDINIMSSFSSLTGGTIGGFGSVPTWGQFYAALSMLKNQRAPGQYVAVMHPYQWHHLGTAAAVAGGVTQTNAPEFQNAVQSQFWVGRAAGVNIYVSSNVPLSGGTAATYAIFARDALGFDVRRPMRIEPERDASRRAWELNLSMIYGYGVWRPKFGVQVKTNAVAPTG